MAKKDAPTEQATPSPEEVIAATKKKIEDAKNNAVAKFARDENGLLKNELYVFKDDGSVDWKAMIPKQYLVVNKDYFEQRQIDIPTSVDGLDDKQLLVLLGGFKELAKLRGVVAIDRTVVESGPSRAVVSCQITFTENYETKAGMPIVYSDVASATIDNTAGFSSSFLETIAANRAFVRALRNALRIDIVGSDEIKPTFSQKPSESDSNGVSVSAFSAVRDAALKFRSEKTPNGFKDFAEFKDFLVKREYNGASEWNDWKDITNAQAFELLKKLKKPSTAPAA